MGPTAVGEAACPYKLNEQRGIKNYSKIKNMSQYKTDLTGFF